MSSERSSVSDQAAAINRAFSRQSHAYDEADAGNVILQDLRQQVYRHVEKFLSPSSHILELNAGTGIDAMHFASQGHRVHATDLSDGMIHQIEIKISRNNLSDKLTCQQISFENLDKVSKNNFDYVFSNFGGLNCSQDLSRVTRHLPSLLKTGAYVTWVIMPPLCLWELLWILRGDGRKAFRRLKKDGTLAHIEGESFRTYYHSLKSLHLAFGNSFRLVESEGLAALSPPPHRQDFPSKHPRLYKWQRTADRFFRKTFPFNRCADHIIVTFQYDPKTGSKKV